MHLDIHSLLNLEELGSKSPASSTAIPALHSNPTSDLRTASAPDDSESILSALLLLLRTDIESKSQKLLEFNPSRREALVLHLHLLAGTKAPEGTVKRSEQLRLWLEEIRSPAQNHALHHYIRFVATLTLGQAILLKAWHDRGIRNLRPQDLQNLQWTLRSTLDPHQPLDSRGWQFTQPSLYSWYQPSPELQAQLWQELQKLNFHDEGPQTFALMMKRLMQHQDDHPIPSQGSDTNGLSINASTYDRRFYDALWSVFEKFDLFPKVFSPAFHSAHIANRVRYAFTPTLRDGSFIRASSPSLHWAGMEISTERLFLGELIQLWWGPSAPPLWSQGFGIECHSRDQLSLNFQSKTCLKSKLGELESCEVAWIQEENCLRLNAPSTSSQMQVLLKETLEQSPYLQTLLSAKTAQITPQTSLGALQACVAMTKLRPGSYLLWLREEPLGPLEGQRALSFLFERSTLVAEWNLSEIQHQLPSEDRPFSKYLYLFRREPDLQIRSQHYPLRITVQGQVRSYIELPQFISEVFSAPFLQVDSSDGKPGTSLPWTVFSLKSTTAQMDWIEHWPAISDQQVIESLSRLEKSSIPLANLCTVRAFHHPLHPSLNKFLSGFVVSRSGDSDSSGLKCQSIPASSGSSAHSEFKSAFIVGVPSEAWVAPLQTYLESPWIQQWLDERAEKKGNRWVLTEQLLKWIPLPRTLAELLDQTADPFLPQLDENVERLVRNAQTRIAHATETFSETAWTPEQHLQIFTRVSRLLDTHRQEYNQLRSVIRAHGIPCWSQVLKLLPRSELVPMTLHPQLHITGKLPIHTPIFKSERQKAPLPGVLLLTEAGFSQQLSVLPGAHQALIAEMLWDQIKELGNLTWSELVQFVRIPRRAELAKESAQDLLQSHHELQAKMKSFQALLYKCRLF